MARAAVCCTCRRRPDVLVERRSSSRIARVAKFFSDSESSSDGSERVERERLLSMHLHTELGASRRCVG